VWQPALLRNGQAAKNCLEEFQPIVPTILNLKQVWLSNKVYGFGSLEEFGSPECHDAVDFNG